jgi:hypothetical protein
MRRYSETVKLINMAIYLLVHFVILGGLLLVIAFCCCFGALYQWQYNGPIVGTIGNLMIGSIIWLGTWPLRDRLGELIWGPAVAKESFRQFLKMLIFAPARRVYRAESKLAEPRDAL